MSEPKSEEARALDPPPEAPLRAYYERMSAARPIRVDSKGAWLQRRAVVRQQTQAALGLVPLPERVPLDVRRGGALEREGYRLERVYWQTWPRVWAGGWLYTPAGTEQPRPAVLGFHGHWPEGARHPDVQSRHVALALLGYPSLLVDSAHVYELSLGVTPLTVMTLRNLRALDLLAGLPGVDRERIAVVGESGGAQQAMYLLALDERPRAAVLAVLVSYFHRILRLVGEEGHHCSCNHVPGIMRFTDAPELCGVASPRALQFLTVTDDWTEPFPRHELGELRALYRLWQQPDRLEHRQFPGPHAFTREMREAAYGFLARELRGEWGRGPVAEPDHQVESPEALLELNAPPAEDEGEAGILGWFRRRVIANPPQLESRPARKHYQKRASEELAALLGDEPPPVALDAEVTPAPGGPGFLVSLASEPDVRLSAVWRPAAAAHAPAVLALHPEGRKGALRSALVRALAAAGMSVLAPDFRLRGDLKRDWRYNCRIWGRPEAAMAARDARTCIEWLFQQEAVDPRAVIVLGEGDQGMTALLAAAFDERPAAVAADCCLALYRDGGEGLPEIPGVLRVGDVPQIASLLAPRPLCLYRVPGDRIGFSSRRYFDWTRRTYQSLGDEDALWMLGDREPEPAALLAWLAARGLLPRSGPTTAAGPPASPKTASQKTAGPEQRRGKEK